MLVGVARADWADEYHTTACMKKPVSKVNRFIHFGRHHRKIFPFVRSYWLKVVRFSRRKIAGLHLAQQLTTASATARTLYAKTASREQKQITTSCPSSFSLYVEPVFCRQTRATPKQSRATPAQSHDAQAQAEPRDAHVGPHDAQVAPELAPQQLDVIHSR